MVMNRRLLRLATAALTPLALATSACSQSSQVDSSERDEVGQVVEGGDVGVFLLQESDCIRLPTDIGSTEVEQIEDVRAIPCAEPHDGEVVLVDDGYFNDTEVFPGEDEAVDQGTDSCIAALDEYTGTDYDTSSFDAIVLVPSEQSWTVLDDRGLICIGLTLDEAQTDSIDTTGSIRAGG